MIKFIISRQAVEGMLAAGGTPTARLNELDRDGNPTGNLVCLVHQTAEGFISKKGLCLLQEAIALSTGIVYMCSCHPALITRGEHPRLVIVGRWTGKTLVHTESRDKRTATLVLEGKRD